MRAGLIGPAQPLQKYRWSSYGEYLKPPGRRADWVRVDRLLGEWNIRRDDIRGRREFQRLMEQRREDKNHDWKELRRGWCWGDEGFRERLLNLLGEETGEHHYGEEVRESDEEKANRLIRDGLAQAGCREAELKLQRKGDIVKVRLAHRLRRETTMSWRWIAERLHMGHWRSAANAVRLRS